MPLGPLQHTPQLGNEETTLAECVAHFLIVALSCCSASGGEGCQWILSL